MRTKFSAAALFLLVVVIINSCENKQAAVPLSVGIPNCDTTNLTYSSGSNTMQAIINVQCGVTTSTSCHSPDGASGFDYSTYSGIYAKYQNGQLYGVLFGNGSLPRMPLVQQPGWDACILAKFRAWIDQGCPQ